MMPQPIYQQQQGPCQISVFKVPSQGGFQVCIQHKRHDGFEHKPTCQRLWMSRSDARCLYQALDQMIALEDLHLVEDYPD